MAAYFYYWSIHDKKVKAGYAKNTADGHDKLKVIGTAKNAQEARECANAHYTKAVNMASVAGRAIPEKISMI
jgi:hypothetical protein